MDLLEFRKVFDFIQEEKPATKLNDDELRDVFKWYNEWKNNIYPKCQKPLKV